MKKLAIATATVMLSCGIAHAADMRPVYKAPVAAPPAYYNWTGFYVGGHLGWADGDTRIDWTGNAFEFQSPAVG